MVERSAGEQAAPPDMIVVGVDGSEAGERAARFAAGIARADDTSVVVACVVPWSAYTVQTAEENEQRRVTKQRETQATRSSVLFGSTPGNLIQISTVPVTVVP